ncbi:HIT family protein [Nakamurella endophytica]
MRLWTPHRMAYVTASEPASAALDDRPAGDAAARGTAAASGGGAGGRTACPFCRIPTMSDADGLVVGRGRHVFAVLNLYPYNPGHLMVVPYRHIPDYTDLDPDELAEFSELTRHALAVIRSVSAPHGFNIGINAGSPAGAGIAAHLHQHVVPRWSGDANFMTVIGGTKVLPQLLTDTRALLADAW